MFCVIGSKGSTSAKLQFIVKAGRHDTQYNDIQHNVRIKCVTLNTMNAMLSLSWASNLSVVILSVVMMSVTILSIIMQLQSVSMLIVNKMIVILLTGVMLSTMMLRVIMLNVLVMGLSRLSLGWVSLSWRSQRQRLGFQMCLTVTQRLHFCYNICSFIETDANLSHYQGPML